MRTGDTEIDEINVLPACCGVLTPLKERVLSCPQKTAPQMGLREARESKGHESPPEMALPVKEPRAGTCQGPEAKGAPGDYPLVLV